MGSKVGGESGLFSVLHHRSVHEFDGDGPVVKHVLEGFGIRARYLLPGRSLLRAGYTKETHPHNVGLWLHDVRRDVSKYLPHDVRRDERRGVNTYLIWEALGGDCY